MNPDEIGRLGLLLSEGNRLSKLKEGFEERPAQLDMVALVTKGFAADQIVAAEAGTGVGKSLAYLLPALVWAAEERIVISTGTITLQHQLYNNDVPLAQKILGSDIPCLLLKGRGNYLCPARLADEIGENALFRESEPILAKVQEWAGVTETGEFSDAPFMLDWELQSRINAAPAACSSQRCRLSNCFIAQLRMRARRARLLVVNHHLLLTDLRMRLRMRELDANEEDEAVLPPFDRVICDEAHSIEQSAISCFSSRLSRPELDRLTTMLLRIRNRRSVGLVPRLRRQTGGKVSTAAIGRLIEHTQEQMQSVDGQALDLLGDDASLRLKPDAVESYTPLFTALEALATRLDALCHTLLQMVNEASERGEPPATEVETLVSRLSEMMETALGFSTLGEARNRLFYIERHHATMRLVHTELDIGRILRETLYRTCSTVIFSSATLTVGERFDWWLRRVGLLAPPASDGAEGGDGAANGVDSADADAGYSIEECSSRLSCGLFHSGFDYSNRVFVGIPTDAPEPNSEDYAGFLMPFIDKALAISEGGALILFTSNQLLDRVADGCRQGIEERGIGTLKQGEGDRAQLLRQFNADKQSVLFATNSFWEGIDVPGEALRLVVLTRLPFPVPTEPITEARLMAAEERGGNPFMEVSLPEAIVRLRQGFGRLMRSSTDRGAVLITDSRIVRKRYGELMLKSLPETRRSITGNSQLLVDLEDFYYTQRT